MNEILSLFTLSDLLLLVIFVVMSLVVGSIWFHPRVFGTLYARWMGLPIPKPGQMPKGMAGTFIAEIISRILYFGLIVIAFATDRGVSYNHNMKYLFGVMGGLFILHTCTVFATQLSVIAWTKAEKKAVILISGNTFIQTMLAAAIWYAFFV